MTIVTNSTNVIQMFGECHAEKTAEKPLKKDDSEKFGDLSYCVPKNKHDAPPNTEHFPDDVPIGALKSQFPSEWQSFKNMRYDRCGPTGDYTLSPEFADFRKFMNHMGRKPAPDYTIDRIDPNNVEYSPTNCRWASKQLQSENKGSARYLTDDTGVTLSVSEWSRVSDIPRTTILQRLKYGWAEHDCVHTPVGSRRNRKRGLHEWELREHPTIQELRQLLQSCISQHVSQYHQGLMYRAYVQANPSTLSPDDGHVPDFDTVVNAASGLFRQQLQRELCEVAAALRSGQSVPPTPAYDCLSGER